MNEAETKGIVPKEEQDYHDISGILAIAYMQYLDEHRPSGKMCLSSAECKEIDDAFKNKDWSLIVKYAKKYSPNVYVEKEALDAYPILPTPLGDDNRAFRCAYVEGCKRTIKKYEEDILPEVCEEECVEGVCIEGVDDVVNETAPSKEEATRMWVRSFFENLIWRIEYPFTKKEVLDSIKVVPSGVTYHRLPENEELKIKPRESLELTCNSDTCAYRGKGVCTYKTGDYCPMYTEKAHE